MLRATRGDVSLRIPAALLPPSVLRTPVAIRAWRSLTRRSHGPARRFTWFPRSAGQPRTASGPALADPRRGGPGPAHGGAGCHHREHRATVGAALARVRR